MGVITRVRRTSGTPEAATRTPYAQRVVRPWGQAALRLRYVQYAGGRYVQPVVSYGAPQSREGVGGGGAGADKGRQAMLI